MIFHVYSGREQVQFLQQLKKNKKTTNKRRMEHTGHQFLTATGYWICIKIIVGNEQYSQSSVAAMNLFFFEIYKMNL